MATSEKSDLAKLTLQKVSFVAALQDEFGLSDVWTVLHYVLKLNFLSLTEAHKTDGYWSKKIDPSVLRSNPEYIRRDNYTGNLWMGNNRRLIHEEGRAVDYL